MFSSKDEMERRIAECLLVNSDRQDCISLQSQTFKGFFLCYRGIDEGARILAKVKVTNGG